MTIAFRQKAQAYTATDPQPCSFAGLPLAGSNIIVHAGSRNNNPITSISDTLGTSFSRLSKINASTGTDDVWMSAPLGAVGASYQVNVATGNTNHIVGILEITSPFGITVDLTPVTQNLSSNAAVLTMGGANTSADALVIASLTVGGFFNAVTSMTNPPAVGYTSWFFFDGNVAIGNASVGAYKVLTATETSAVTWGWDIADTNFYYANLITLKPLTSPPAGGGTDPRNLTQPMAKSLTQSLTGPL